MSYFMSYIADVNVDFVIFPLKSRKRKIPQTLVFKPSLLKTNDYCIFNMIFRFFTWWEKNNPSKEGKKPIIYNS